MNQTYKLYVIQIEHNKNQTNFCWLPFINFVDLLYTFLLVHVFGLILFT